MMANSAPLPCRDQVTRGCSGGYDKGEVTATAFAMRPIDKNLRRISVDWVECSYAQECARDLEGSVNRLRQVRPPVRPPYAVLGVTDIRQVRRQEWALDAKEFGTKANPCHCGITGFSDTHVDLGLQQDLAEIANRSPVLETP